MPPVAVDELAYGVAAGECASVLGASTRTFRTPHGLPPASRRAADGDLTTPRDYATLSRQVLRQTNVAKYTGVRQRKFGEGRRPVDRVIDMINHNHLLGRVAGVNGLKTGYTNSAGYCLAASAERDGRSIIVIVMGSPDSKTRDLKVIALLDRGFAQASGRLTVVKGAAGVGGALRPDPAAAAQSPGHKAPPAETLPTVKTEKAEPAKQSELSSTPKEPGLIFRVIPPSKKP